MLEVRVCHFVTWLCFAKNGFVLGVWQGLRADSTLRMRQKRVVRRGRLTRLRRIDLVAKFLEVLEFVEEGAPADAEGFGGFGAVEVVVPQRLEDGLALDAFEVLGVGGQ